MNYIRHLNAFFSYVKTDTRLTSSHVSLYMALFQSWNFNRFKNPFPITREDIMALSAIGSKNTYHKVLKELHQFGYIFYRASINKFHRSTVHIVKFNSGDSIGALQQLDLFSHDPGPANAAQNPPATIPNPVQVKDFTGIKIDTVQVPILTFDSPKFDTLPVPYLGLLIKHKHINNKQEREENSLTQKIFSKNEKINQEINNLGRVSNRVHTCHPERSEVPHHPDLLQVLEFFTKNNYPVTEAKKFFNHYQSNGWLVAGKTPMKDWQSSAHKWMINFPNFQIIQKPKNESRQQQHHLDTGPGKNYSEPL